jgi:hypothetical protein
MRVVLFTSVLFVCRPAAAEINIVESLELLCIKAKWIVAGELVDVTGPKKATGKSTRLGQVILKLDRVVAGAALNSKRVYFSIRREHERLKALQKRKAKVLVFLRETKQGYRKDGISWHLWPLHDKGTSQLLVIEPRREKRRLLAATGLKPVWKLPAITRLCRAARRKAKLGGAARGGSPLVSTSAALDPRYLDVPFGSAAHRYLYAGSACYLIVPGAMFPSAKKSMH